MNTLLRWSSNVSRGFAWVGGLMLLACAALVSLDVVFRAVWKVTYFESFELSTYAFAIATAMGMSYALVTRAHIRIEVVYSLAPARWRAWLDVFAYVGMALVSGVLLFWCAQVVLGNWQTGARSNSSLSLPLVYPQGLWLLGLAWFAWTAALYAVFGLWRCLSGRTAEAHERLGVATLQEEITASTGRRIDPC